MKILPFFRHFYTQAANSAQSRPSRPLLKTLADPLLPCLKASATVALLLSFSQFGSAADLYKWTDEDGVIHFTDKPPKGVEAEKIKKKVSKRVITEDSEEDSAEENNNESPSTTAKQQNAERCQAERDRLRVLQSNTSIRMTMEDGTVKVLTPEEITKEIAFAQKAIDYFCE